MTIPFQRGESTDPERDARLVEDLRPEMAGAMGDRRLVLLGELAELLRGLGRFDEAIETGRTAVELASDLHDDAREMANRIRLATAMQYGGRHEESVAEFEVALSRSGSGSDEYRHFALQHMGKCLVEMGLIDRARDSFREALAIREGLGHVGYLESTRAALAAIGEG